MSLPRRLMSSRTQRVKRRASHESTRVPDDAWLRRDNRRSKPKIQLFHAGGREAEIEEVFRRILTAGVALDQVEIACASDAHLALVWEKALRHNWPVTLGPGIPATFTRPGRALLGFCDWIETDFSAGHLRRLLQSGDMSVEEHEGFTAGQAARVLARAEAGWGRATYAPGPRTASQELRSSRQRSGRVGRGPRRRAGEGRANCTCSQWITDLVASVPTAGHRGRFRCRRS